MRRWRRPGLSEVEFDLDEEEEEVEEEARRYIARPLRVTRFSDFDEDETIADDIARFDKIQGLIRAGKYKPKESDPYTAHVLYSSLKQLGEI